MGYSFVTNKRDDASTLFSTFVETHCKYIAKAFAQVAKTSKSIDQRQLISEHLHLTIQFCLPPPQYKENTYYWYLLCRVHLGTRQLFEVRIEYCDRFSFDLDHRCSTAKLHVSRITEPLRYLYAIVASLPTPVRLHVDATTLYVIGLLEKLQLRDEQRRTRSTREPPPHRTLIGKLTELSNKK